MIDAGGWPAGLQRQKGVAQWHCGTSLAGPSGPGPGLPQRVLSWISIGLSVNADHGAKDTLASQDEQRTINTSQPKWKSEAYIPVLRLDCKACTTDEIACNDKRISASGG